ncbi:hypothetical protein Ahy_A08g040643 [Arachis hypogaea]|uniref:SWIM-type domain-containing protein n=1 Tax=Arachis hypogaea TaxID=3818 RepID=A0A445BZW1_ARAHY|nr:hypothetical protein Ahy_A08g040643 [Arachis hypogaea]
MRVTHCNRRALVFAVEELEPLESWSLGSFRVRLSARTCDCGIFQSLHFPCCHALAACAAASIEWGRYVHPVYKQENVFKMYEVKFPPIPDKKLWPEWYGTHLHPNPAMRQKATERLVSMKFQNEMDEVERVEKRCGMT